MKRPPAGTIPDAPGSYQFKDAHGRVIYVGKASSLRQRLSNYFQAPHNLHPRTAPDGRDRGDGRVDDVRNEVEALMLEYSLIKQHRPRFNVRLRDDKSYPFLAVTVDEQWPRALVMRGRKRKGTRYFGPYAHAYAIRDTLDLLLRSFPIRTCSPAKFNQHQRLGRPCLLFHIEKCAGPCVGEIEEMPYRAARRRAVRLPRRRHRRDRQAARGGDAARRRRELEFERAARLRDRLIAVRKAIAKQQMVADRNEDIDVIGIAEDDLEAAVQVFYVRKGRVVGRKGFVLDKVEELTPGGLVDRILEAMYGDEPPTGVPEAGAGAGASPTTSATYEEWLSPPARLAGADPRAAAGRQAGAARDGDAQRQRGVHPPPPAPGERSQHARAARSPSCRTCSGCRRRRCGSSATTWRTCRAPTTSARWWCSRTGCRTSASTAGSRSRTCRATTTTRRWKRC